MNLVSEIRQKFSYLHSTDNGSYRLSELDSNTPTWVLRIDGEYAVGIEIDENMKVNEAFSNVSYYTHEFLIEKDYKYLLILSSPSSDLRSEFAGIAAMFIEPGENNSKRNKLLSSPQEWWETWKDLLGNRNIDNTVHGMIGELLFLFYLKGMYGEDMTIESWTGPSFSSQDFVMKERTYEVKSTLIKYTDVVNISSQFQINAEDKSYLIFIKLEEVPSDNNSKNNISINRLLILLNKQGFDDEILSNYVNKMGFLKNSLDRSLKFKVLEIRKYKIDEHFPTINTKNIINGQNILQVNYKISLSGLEYELLNQVFSKMLDDC